MRMDTTTLYQLYSIHHTQHAYHPNAPASMLFNNWCFVLILNCDGPGQCGSRWIVRLVQMIGINQTKRPDGPTTSSTQPRHVLFALFRHPSVATPSCDFACWALAAAVSSTKEQHTTKANNSNKILFEWLNDPEKKWVIYIYILCEFLVLSYVPWMFVCFVCVVLLQRQFTSTALHPNEKELIKVFSSCISSAHTIRVFVRLRSYCWYPDTDRQTDTQSECEQTNKQKSIWHFRNFRGMVLIKNGKISIAFPVYSREFVKYICRYIFECTVISSMCSQLHYTFVFSHIHGCVKIRNPFIIGRWLFFPRKNQRLVPFSRIMGFVIIICFLFLVIHFLFIVIYVRLCVHAFTDHGLMLFCCSLKLAVISHLLMPVRIAPHKHTQLAVDVRYV